MKKDNFINSYLPLVTFIAKKYSPFTKLTLSDIINEGNLGLLKAAEKYKEEKGAKFSTYAYYWIRRYILRAIDKSGQVVSVPENIEQLSHKWRRKEEYLRQALQREPTIEEVAERMEMKNKEVKRIRKREEIREISIDQPIKNEGGKRLLEILSFPSTSFEIDTERDELLSKLFSKVSKREKKVVKMRFGLSKKPRKGPFGPSFSFREIAERLSLQEKRAKPLSRQRIHQIYKNGIFKMKRNYLIIKNKFNE